MANLEELDQMSEVEMSAGAVAPDAELGGSVVE